MYIEKHLIDIKLIKDFLSTQEVKSFTKRDFIENTRSTPYYFKEMVRFGLIVNTGLFYTSQRGSPIAYELNEAFLDKEPALKSGPPSYNLTPEEIDLLIQNKSIRVENLNNKIAVMQTQVNSLKTDHDSLFKLKSKIQ
jgi:hypothetical protein